MARCLLFALSFLLASCIHPNSSETLEERQAQSRPRSAAYAADGFYNESYYKEDNKSIPIDNFFFKKCRINQTAPYPSMNQWECTEAIK